MLSQYDEQLAAGDNNGFNKQGNATLYSFDFVDADDFLDSISGALPNNGHNNVNPNTNDISFEDMNIMNPNIYSPVSAASGDDFTQSSGQPMISEGSNYTGQNFTDYLSDNSLEGYDKNTSRPLHEVDIGFSNKRSNSTSTGSLSHNEEITPISHYSVDSIVTSPEPPINKQGDFPPIKRTTTVSSTNSITNTTKKPAKVTKPKSKDKNSHNMIEKKYRTNINTKILALRDAVPALRIAAGCDDVSIADLEGLTPASKLNKASVLTKATEYIKHLESKNFILKQQNIELHRLIQHANMNPKSLPPPPQQMQAPPQPGFGFYPPQNQSFNVTPASQYPSPQQQVSPTQQQTVHHPPQPNRYLLGGMAAVMGTSLFGGSGENDFRSLSALPFSYLFPNAILNPSPLTIQLWTLTKVLLVVGSLASIFIPMYKQAQLKKEDKPNTIPETSLLDWILISIGFKIPAKLSVSKRDAIISNLQGGNDWSQLVSDYFYLAGCEINFENCFLSLVLGTIIRHRFPVVATILNHYLLMKEALLLNLDYKGSNKSLIRLNQLISKVDGVSIFESTNLTTRLTNVFTNNRINANIVDGQNHVKYIEFYQRNINDYYAIVFNWRLLEFIHELNVTYLEQLNDDQSQVLTDLKIIEAFFGEQDNKLFGYYQLFTSILNANYAPYLFESLKDKVESSLEKFRIAYEGIDLTDHEIHNTSSEDEYEQESPVVYKYEPTLKSQKSLISSLNLVNEEEFIILTCSLTIYYYKNKEYDRALKLLNYLRLDNDSKTLSLLTFTSLITLINELIPGKIEDNVNLDSAIRICRDWLENPDLTQYMDEDIKLELKKIVVTKGMIVNGIDVNESDEE